MAEGKKSFILYCDQKEVWDELSNEEAGKLIKHLFSYVNDENPILDDKYVKIASLPIIKSLKRDLIKWEDKQKQRSDAGKRSAELRKTKANEQQRDSTTVGSRSTNPTVSVNDNVSVNVNVNDIKEEIKGDKPPVSFPFKKSLLNLGIEESIVSDWLKVRKTKRSSNTETAFNSLVKQIGKSGLSANKCIKIAVVKSWAGFNADWIDKGDIEDIKPKYQGEQRFKVKYHNDTRQHIHTEAEILAHSKMMMSEAYQKTEYND